MEDAETETQLELSDLGDAMEETKQIAPILIYPDSTFGWGHYY